MPLSGQNVIGDWSRQENCGSVSLGLPTPHPWAEGLGWVLLPLTQVTTVRVQNELPQDVLFWLTNYIELKMIKAQKTGRNFGLPLIA